MTHKRRRVDVPVFRPGYLVNVQVENFTTYTFAEFKLSPTLNMIIGPNGTGKSTLVAAICLGLGGKLDLIKRKNMKSMIKTGCLDARIRIEIKNTEGKPNIVITRRFTERTNAWTIDDSASDEKQVRGLVRSFNIQLDNLCHFLPQERVAEFATLSPEKLLLEVERTLGDGSLLEAHEALIQQDADREELASEIARLEERLSVLKQESDVLEEEVKKFQEYEEKTKEIKLHKWLVPYGQYQDLKSFRKRLKKSRDQAKKALEGFNDKVAPIKQHLEGKRMLLSEAEDALKDNDNLKDKRKEYDEACAARDTTKDDIADLVRRVERARAKAKDSKAILEREEVELSKLTEKLKELPEVDEEQLDQLTKNRTDNHNQQRELEREARDIDRGLSESKRALDTLAREKKVYEHRLVANDKIEVLKSTQTRYRPDIMEKAYNALLHLRNRPQFKGQYEEAPVVSCDVTDRKYAKYVEKVIDNNTLFSLICPNKAAFDAVSKEVSSYRVSLRTTSETRASPVPKERLKEYGFDCYVSDFLTGPATVLNCLNSQNYLNSIPVSLKPLSESHLSRLLNPGSSATPFMKFIAEDTLFTLLRSRYGQKQYVYQTEGIHEAHLFGHTGLSSEMREDLQQKIGDLDGKIKEEMATYKQHQSQSAEKKQAIEKLKEAFEKIDNQQKEFKNNHKARVRLEEVISSKEDKIRKMRDTTAQEAEERIRRGELGVLAKYKELFEASQTIATIFTELHEVARDRKKRELHVLHLKNQVRSFEALMTDLEKYHETMQEVYDTAARKYDESKNNDAHKQIQEQSKDFTPEERSQLSDLAAKYLQEGTLSEQGIRSKILLLEDERSVMSHADQSSINALRDKLSEMELAERNLPRLKTRKADFDKRVDTIQSGWEAKLTKLVAKISRSFQKRFTHVASDGQVELVKEDRFKDWKLQILVKFRDNSELKVLDHQSQSGGERAVSTIFFIMSLQGLTDAPLRIVDEINQGMDPSNEKMAHRYLVHTACTRNNSQYFLVTPKLLTGLYYHPQMMIHCIYTGVHVDPVDQAKPGYLDMKRRLVRV